MFFGEGPTEIVEGSFNDIARSPFTCEDIRFTYKAPYIYANVLKWPEDGEVLIKSLAKESKHFRGDLKTVELLGFDGRVTCERLEEGLKIKVDQEISTSYPVCLKLLID